MHTHSLTSSLTHICTQTINNANNNEWLISQKWKNAGQTVTLLMLIQYYLDNPEPGCHLVSKFVTVDGGYGRVS